MSDHSPQKWLQAEDELSNEGHLVCTILHTLKIIVNLPLCPTLVFSIRPAHRVAAQLSPGSAVRSTRFGQPSPLQRLVGQFLHAPCSFHRTWSGPLQAMYIEIKAFVRFSPGSCLWQPECNPENSAFRGGRRSV